MAFFKALEFLAPCWGAIGRQRIELISRWILSDKEVASQFGNRCLLVSRRSTSWPRSRGLVHAILWWFPPHWWWVVSCLVKKTSGHPECWMWLSLEPEISSHLLNSTPQWLLWKELQRQWKWDGPPGSIPLLSLPPHCVYAFLQTHG